MTNICGIFPSNPSTKTPSTITTCQTGNNGGTDDRQLKNRMPLLLEA